MQDCGRARRGLRHRRSCCALALRGNGACPDRPDRDHEPARLEGARRLAGAPRHRDARRCRRALDRRGQADRHDGRARRRLRLQRPRADHAARLRRRRRLGRAADGGGPEFWSGRCASPRSATSTSATGSPRRWRATGRGGRGSTSPPGFGRPTSPLSTSNARSPPGAGPGPGSCSPSAARPPSLADDAHVRRDRRGHAREQPLARLRPRRLRGHARLRDALRHPHHRRRRQPRRRRAGRQSSLRGGLRIAFLGFAEERPAAFDAGPGTPGTDAGAHRLHPRGRPPGAADADVVVVYFHWGVELDRTPTRASGCWRRSRSTPARIRRARRPPARAAAARAARRNRFVAWSLGNFVFDWTSPGTDRTGILRLGLGRNGVASSSFLPARINWVQPRPQ